MRGGVPSTRPPAAANFSRCVKHFLLYPQMVAALLRVIHGGAQDVRLLPPKGQPNIGFFVKAFVRAGRFTTQWVRLDFDTRPILGQQAVITLPVKGQLLSKLYLVTTMPDIHTPQLAARTWCAENGATFAGPTFGWTNSVGHALLTEAQIDIGGSRVEVIDGRLLEVLDEFYTPLEKVPLMDSLLPRDTTGGFKPGRFGRDTVTRAVTPLPFWFSSGDPGTYLPLDALQADPVKVTFRFAGLNSLYVSDTLATTSSQATPAPAGSAYTPLIGATFKTAAGATIPGVQMPVAEETFTLGETYLMAEYIYLDRPEANRFRIADIQIPVLQHYAFDPVDTVGASRANVYLKIPNPTRNLFFYAHRIEADSYNAPFLATRDLSGQDAPRAPWWPNASRIDPRAYSTLQPAYQFRNSEPLKSINLLYGGKLYRYSTVAPSLFRSLLPAFEQTKAPWVHRYYYNLPFCLDSGRAAPSQPVGQANLDKIVNINLQLEFNPFAGYSDPNAVPRYQVYCWAETYNILRVYGGRGGMMFKY